MGKILGFIFNRWTALALLIVLLLLVIWIIGPLVAIGEWRPLDSTTARWIVTAVLLLMVAVIIGIKLWRAKAGNNKVVEQLAAAPAGAQESGEMASVRARFAEALDTLRSARFGAEGGFASGLKNKLGGRYLYQLPWYLIIGAPGAGKTTALRNAGLNFPLASKLGQDVLRGVGGTRLCDWWFTDQAVLIDTAGRFTTQDSDAANDKATWNGFLGLLKSSRKRQPLNGVLVTVSVSDLAGKSAAERMQHAQTVRARVQELHQQLKVRLPIYLLVTKCDLMAGFTEHFASLDKDGRAAPWGFTFPMQGGGKVGDSWAERLMPEFNALLHRLDLGLVDRLQAETDVVRRTRMYGFPNQFANLGAPLEDFVRQVFAPSPYEADPLLRGVYFVSGTQEGTPIDRVLGAVSRRYRVEQAILPPQKASGRSFFLQRLLTEVVFAEHGLAGTDRGWERKRHGLAIAAYALIALMAIGALTAWTISWRNNAAYVEQVAQRVEAVRRQVQETPNRASPDLLPVLPALEATRSLAAAAGTTGDASVPWSFGFGLYQGTKLDGAARTAYERMLVDAVQPRLALRVEEQLRGNQQPETLYEALKAYIMMYEPARFEAAALKAHIEGDWEARLGREITQEQRDALSRHLDALLSQGAAVSPLPQDKALIESTRNTLAAVPLPQRVYNRLRNAKLGATYPEVTVISASNPNAQLVFVRSGNLPLTKGVSGLFTYDGYHKGFKTVVGDVTRQLAAEQTWVLGIAPAQAQGPNALIESERLTDDVRRLYLIEYRETWKAFIDSVRMLPIKSMSEAIERTRILGAADSPLLPMLRRFSKETTLLAAAPGVVGQATQRAGAVVDQARQQVLNTLGVKPPTTGAPGERIESIVDDEFRALRALVTAPEGGGKALVEGMIERLKEVQLHLMAVKSAVDAKQPPPASALPNQMRAEAANSPEPVRGLLEALGSAAGKIALIQLRESLSREVRAQIGDFCQQAVGGRYPFDGSSARDVTPADFAALFGPGGRFEQMMTRLAPYVDTSTKPWRFLPVDGTPLGTDSGTLPQFQRAQIIREAFFAAGPVPGIRMTMKPLEMDTQLREFLLDVDGQLVKYDHGPQIPVEVKWPGLRNTNVVRVTTQPVGPGLVNDGAWALLRLFERVSIVPGAAPEKFKAVFDVGGRKATFDVTTSSVRNALRLPELRSFQCPQGL